MRIVFTITLVLLFSGCGFGQNKQALVDPLVDRFFVWAKGVESFKAVSVQYDKNNNEYGITEFVFDKENWEMLMRRKKTPLAHWIKVNEKQYLFDKENNWWWESGDGEVNISSRIDFRKFVDFLENYQGEVRFVKQKDETCGEIVCVMYLVLDEVYESGRENVKQRIWLDQETGAILKEEYVGDTGRSVTEFGEFNQAEVKVPINVKKLPEGEDLFLQVGK